SAHISVLMPMAMRIRAPPMVGVPVFCRWVWGPYERTAWPIFSSVSLRMTKGPATRPMSNAVAHASTARKVMYSTTPKPLMWLSASQRASSSSMVVSRTVAGLIVTQGLHHALHARTARPLHQHVHRHQGLQRRHQRRHAFEMLATGPEGLNCMTAGVAQHHQAIHPLFTRIGTHFSVHGITVLTHFGHGAEHQHFHAGKPRQ